MSSLTLIGAHRAVSELLENRPKSWDVVRFKGLFQRLDRRNVDLTYEMLSLRSTGEIVARAEMGGRQEPDEASLPKYLIAEIDDLVVNPMWLIGGGIGVSRRAGAVSPDYRVFRSRGALLPRFVHQLLRSQPYLDQYLLYTRAQTTFDRRVQQPDLDNLPLPVPPLEEQRVIAEYLDRETARIDTLIEEQQRLIEMLSERRVAKVAETLEGHERTQVRRLVDHDRPMTYGILQCGEPIDGGVVYIGPSDIQGEGLSPYRYALRTTAPEIASAYRRSVLKGGDVVVSIGPAYGKVAVVSDDLDGANLTQDTVRLALRPDLVDTRFFVWALLSRQTAEYWDYQIMGATFRRLNLGTLARTPIPLPAIHEQRRIAEYLDEQTAKIDTLIAEAERFIELSRERRSALITEAVTGQIDVRGAA
ncbi:restriction endonuclease subunit S [Streptomyces sp. NPDC056921]|uniref:restriction endonuclease subunit S n=1 Tax=Streptomyces sp. NPDC056921 TaxID=3345966 RepID=UPI003625A5BD